MNARAANRHLSVSQVLDEYGVAEGIQRKHVASVLYTYRCTLRCLHCCFYSSPTRPDVHTSHEDGLEHLRQLHAIDRVVHIAGGEALMYWPDLRRLLVDAARQGLAPHFVETNATWCANDGLAADRLRELRDLGVRGLLVSADPFHQRECPVERVQRCIAVACETFGERNVIGARLSPEEARRLEAIAADPVRIREWSLDCGILLSGRAGAEMASWFPRRPVAELGDDRLWHGETEGLRCRPQFEPDEMWEIHIDPYGNAQTCCGIVVGNVARTPLPELWETGFLSNPLVAAVHAEGPVGLLPFAVERGYTAREEYPQRCAMCWELRNFLRPWFPETFGPDDAYVRPPGE